MTSAPIRVTAVNNYEIIVAGVASMLEQFPEHITVSERITIGDPIRSPVDVALYDTYGRVGIAAPALRALRDTPEVRHVTMFSLDLGPDLIAEGRAAGADGFISKSLSAADVVDAPVRVGHER